MVDVDKEYVSRINCMKKYTAQTLTTTLDELLDPTNMPDVCPNGLQVENTGTITKAATAVSASLEAIEKAVELGANALIVHHGIFLYKESPVITNSIYHKVKLLIDNNIALLCYHLPLDAHELGNNWQAAQKLGWQNLQPFGSYNNIALGVRGTFKPTSANELKQTLESFYNNKANVVIGKDTLTSGAIISGNAHKFLKTAISQNVDCFITGTVDEPIWDVAREAGVTFFALGHYATEVIGVRTLADYIQNHLGFQCTFIKTDNPF